MKKSLLKKWLLISSWLFSIWWAIMIVSAATVTVNNVGDNLNIQDQPYVVVSAAPDKDCINHRDWDCCVILWFPNPDPVKTTHYETKCLADDGSVLPETSCNPDLRPDCNSEDFYEYLDSI